MAVTRSSTVSSGSTTQISSFADGDIKKITEIEYNPVTGKVIIKYET